MSMRITRSLSRVLPVAAAALFIHIGGAVAATPQDDIRQQMQEVLSGSVATHAIPSAESDPTDLVGSDADAQEFARQLLLGWSVSHVGGAKAQKQQLQAAAVESSRKPKSSEDFQSTVQQGLLGVRASARDAL